MDPSIFAGVPRPRSRRELVATGTTPGRLRGPRWQRTSQGLYLPADVDASGTLPRIVAAACRVPAGGALGGWAAARALGVEDCDGLGPDGRTILDVPLCVPRSGRIVAVAGIELWCGPLADDDVVDISGIRFTAAPRTCFDGMRRGASLSEAVVIVDQMTHAEVVTVAEMRAYVGRHRGWHGVGQARRALELCDPLARNGWETRMRLVWMLEAGLPRPLCNPPVFDLRERMLGYPDVLDVEAGVVLEYDGEGHRRSRRHDRDNLREDLFEEHGLVVMRVTRVDLDHRVDLRARMLRTRGRGLRRDRCRDTWTLAVPPSWGAMGGDEELIAALEHLDR